MGNATQKKNSLKNTYHLSNADIQAVCGAVSTFLEAHGTAKKETLKVALTLEEALLAYQERLSEDTAVTLKAFAALGTIRAVVTVEGTRLDPFKTEEQSERSIMGTLMAGENAAHASWRYKDPVNEIVFTARRERKLSSLAKICIGFLFGVILGGALLLLPEGTAQTVAAGYIMPVAGAYTGLLCVMAAPMCFFAIVLGIVGVGDLSSFGDMAKKMAGCLAILSVLIALLAMLSASTQLLFGDSAFQTSGMSKLFEILLSFVPTNILSPMLNFNSVQIILVGVMFGASLLAMGQKADNAVELLDTLNSAAVTCNVVYLNRFIPCYVALTVMGIIGSRQFSVGPGFLRLAADVLISELLILSFSAAAVCIRLRIPLRILMKKTSPPFMVALSSASVGAAFVENINSLLALGVESGYAALGYNVGSVIFRPGECAILMASSLYMAHVFNVEVSLFWLMTAFALSYILSIATPPIPGGTAVSLAILFSQLSFPDRALALIVPLSMALEFPTVAVDAFCAKAQVLLLSNSAGKFDRKAAVRE